MRGVARRTVAACAGRGAIGGEVVLAIGLAGFGCSRPSGTGVSDQPGYHFTETIQGSLSGGQFSFEATFTGNSAVQFPGYKWGTNSPGTLGAWIPSHDSLGDSFQLTGTLGTLTTSTWKNHGAYVSSLPEADREAASESASGSRSLSGRNRSRVGL